MVMLMLKRLNVPLDRDVIFLAESGEEGTTRVGIQFMVDQHFAAIDAEYCLAEGGNVARAAARCGSLSVQTLEKIPSRDRADRARAAGHGSVPLKTNAIVHLSGGRGGDRRLAAADPAERDDARVLQAPGDDLAARAGGALSRACSSRKVRRDADDYFLSNEPRHAADAADVGVAEHHQRRLSHQRDSVGSEGDARRAHAAGRGSGGVPRARAAASSNDPAVEVGIAQRDMRPGGDSTRLDSEAFKAIEAAVTQALRDASTLPTMSTGATDMAYLRAKGMQCYGIGPAIDVEDGPKGFGAHSDQERILESELHRFVRFNWDVVVEPGRSLNLRCRACRAGPGRAAIDAGSRGGEGAIVRVAPDSVIRRVHAATMRNASRCAVQRGRAFAARAIRRIVTAADAAAVKEQLAQMLTQRPQRVYTDNAPREAPVEWKGRTTRSSG